MSGKYIEKISETDNRITFKNGSFIKIDGSENYEAYRGINPHFIVYDEFKDFHPKFHEGMEPNLATFEAPIFIFGTPPNSEDSMFCRIEEGFKADEEGEHFEMPTHTNPLISKKWLANMEKVLISRGEWHVWMREYMAQIVPSGALNIFPMFEAPKYGQNTDIVEYSKHCRPREELMEMIRRYPKDYTYHAVLDPASTSTFAVLFAAVHKRTKRVLCLKEIYEKDKGRMSVKQIFPRILEFENLIMPRRDFWREVYDYAAAWFANEVQAEYNIALTPCVKDMRDKEVRLSSIKDFMREGLFLVSAEDCPKLIWEIRNYATDEEGRIPKKNDHLIDDMRYLFNDAGLHTIPKTKYVPDADRRLAPDEDDPDFEEEVPIDFYNDITEEFYD